MAYNPEPGNALWLWRNVRSAHPCKPTNPVQYGQALAAAPIGERYQRMVEAREEFSEEHVDIALRVAVLALALDASGGQGDESIEDILIGLEEAIASCYVMDELGGEIWYWKELPAQLAPFPV